jgi:penicillin amidase
MLAATLGKTLPAVVFAEYSGTNYPARESPIITSSEHISAGAQVLYNGLLGKRATVPQPLDIFGGHSKDAVIREVLRSTDAQLRKQFGGGPRMWRPLVAQTVFSPLLYTGIPAADPSEELVEPIFMNRGTENDLMVATAAKITGYEVAPPGESGFVAPNGARSRHYADQFDLYADFGKKRTWFTPAEVQAHLESVQVLRF